MLGALIKGRRAYHENRGALKPLGVPKRYPAQPVGAKAGVRGVIKPTGFPIKLK